MLHSIQSIYSHFAQPNAPNSTCRNHSQTEDASSPGTPFLAEGVSLKSPLARPQPPCFPLPATLIPPRPGSTRPPRPLPPPSFSGAAPHHGRVASITGGGEGGVGRQPSLRGGGRAAAGAGRRGGGSAGGAEEGPVDDGGGRRAGEPRAAARRGQLERGAARDRAAPVRQELPAAVDQPPPPQPEEGLLLPRRGAPHRAAPRAARQQVGAHGLPSAGADGQRDQELLEHADQAPPARRPAGLPAGGAAPARHLQALPLRRLLQRLADVHLAAHLRRRQCRRPLARRGLHQRAPGAARPRRPARHGAPPAPRPPRGGAPVPRAVLGAGVAVGAQAVRAERALLPPVPALLAGLADHAHGARAAPGHAGAVAGLLRPAAPVPAAALAVAGRQSGGAPFKPIPPALRLQRRPAGAAAAGPPERGQPRGHAAGAARRHQERAAAGDAGQLRERRRRCWQHQTGGGAQRRHGHALRHDDTDDDIPHAGSPGGLRCAQPLGLGLALAAQQRRPGPLGRRHQHGHRRRRRRLGGAGLEPRRRLPVERHVQHLLTRVDHRSMRLPSDRNRVSSAASWASPCFAKSLNFLILSSTCRLRRYNDHAWPNIPCSSDLTLFGDSF